MIGREKKDIERKFYIDICIVIIVFFIIIKFCLEMFMIFKKK